MRVQPHLQDLRKQISLGTLSGLAQGRTHDLGLNSPARSTSILTGARTTTIQACVISAALTLAFPEEELFVCTTLSTATQHPISEPQFSGILIRMPGLPGFGSGRTQTCPQHNMESFTGLCEGDATYPNPAGFERRRAVPVSRLSKVKSGVRGLSSWVSLDSPRWKAACTRIWWRSRSMGCRHDLPAAAWSSPRRWPPILPSSPTDFAKDP